MKDPARVSTMRKETICDKYRCDPAKRYRTCDMTVGASENMYVSMATGGLQL